MRHNPVLVDSSTYGFKMTIFKITNQKNSYSSSRTSRRKLAQWELQQINRGLTNYIIIYMVNHCGSLTRFSARMKAPPQLTSKKYAKVYLSNFLINSLSKQKREMCRSMMKPHVILMNIFYTQLTQLNSYLPLLHVSENTKKMMEEDINEILMHAVPVVWLKQAYI